jgi:RNA polymerase primary sigma factor
MQRAVVQHGRTIRLPVHIVAARSTASRAQRQLMHRLGREPEDPELAAALGVSTERARQALMPRPDAMSLQTPLTDDGQLMLGDVVADPTCTPPDELLQDNDRRALARRVLNDLSAREQEILRLRFGIDNRRPHTLAEIGERFQLTRERIRQIEAKALSKLRRTLRFEQG